MKLYLWVCVAVLIVSAVASGAQPINFREFQCADPAICLNGTAAITPEGVLRLTDDTTLQNGSMFYSKPVDISKFDTTFIFQLYGSGEHADGLTFCIQNDALGPHALGSLGGFLGYGAADIWKTPGIMNSVAVEFDDYCNREFNDPEQDHIGIDVNGSVVSNVTSPSGLPLVGEPIIARVVYDGKMLTVYLRRGKIRPDVKPLSYAIDIPSVLGCRTGYVGFTAATATFFQHTDILSWYFDNGTVRGTTIR